MGGGKRKERWKSPAAATEQTWDLKFIPLAADRYTVVAVWVPQKDITKCEPVQDGTPAALVAKMMTLVGSEKSMSILEQWRSATAEVREYERKRKDPTWEAKRKLLLRDAKEKKATLLASFAQAIREADRARKEEAPQDAQHPRSNLAEEPEDNGGRKEEDRADTALVPPSPQPPHLLSRVIAAGRQGWDGVGTMDRSFL